MKLLVNQCVEIIKTIKEDSFYKEKKCSPENFSQIEDKQFITETERLSPGQEDIDSHIRSDKEKQHLKIHLKKLQQAQQDMALRKTYYTKLEQLENLYINLLERKKNIDREDMLNKVFRQGFQKLQVEKEKLASGKSYQDDSGNISHLLTCINNYTTQFQKLIGLITHLNSRLHSFDNDDIAVNSALYKTLRQQEQAVMEKFRKGEFLSGGIDISIDYFSRGIDEFKKEIIQKEQVTSMASTILKEKMPQYHKHRMNIGSHLFDGYLEAAEKAISLAESKKIYSAASAFDRARIIGESIDGFLQSKFYIESKLNYIAAQDKDKQFARIIKMASSLIKGNHFSKADEILNEISSKIASRESAQLKELATYISLYKNLRSLYIKHSLHSPGSSLVQDIQQLREGIKKGDLLILKNVEYAIIEKMTHLQIDNLDMDKERIVKNEFISFSGTTVPFSSVVMENGRERRSVIADKQGGFSFKAIGLNVGENSFAFYNEYIFPFAGNKTTFSIIREVEKPYRDRTDPITGSPLIDFSPTEILCCQKCKNYFLKTALEDYIKEQKNGCSICQHNEFYSSEDKGFFSLDESFSLSTKQNTRELDY
ncbi:MAG: hypothetical protein ACM3SY_07150 [Candidatus Omnitrophota bacterium]